MPTGIQSCAWYQFLRWMIVISCNEDMKFQSIIIWRNVISRIIKCHQKWLLLLYNIHHINVHYCTLTIKLTWSWSSINDHYIIHAHWRSKLTLSIWIMILMMIMMILRWSWDDHDDLEMISWWWSWWSWDDHDHHQDHDHQDRPDHDHDHTIFVSLSSSHYVVN